MRTSQDGVDLIKRFEGCRLRAYPDSNGLPTIGYGHTKDVSLDCTITQEQADDFLEDDLQEFETYVNHYVKTPLTQHQFDALVSFTYNLGPGTLYHSRLLTYLNSGQYAQAADVFLDYDHSGGVRVAGLTRRREAERDLFLTADSLAAAPPTTVASRVKNWFRRT